MLAVLSLLLLLLTSLGRAGDRKRTKVNQLRSHEIHGGAVSFLPSHENDCWLVVRKPNHPGVLASWGFTIDQGENKLKTIKLECSAHYYTCHDFTAELHAFETNNDPRRPLHLKAGRTCLVDPVLSLTVKVRRAVDDRESECKEAVNKLHEMMIYNGQSHPGSSYDYTAMLADLCIMFDDANDLQV
ncbi:hypothetical protein FOZ62_026898 [Perkinsus olseni]|uniref:Uncharacterized protein n=1 Tax=Perkinsus olseni TaxID=32597 RepID=A0A7J6TY24_PEROL|nr:hypothetical protein FOZ62_026898 [Perkinsus olseni]